MFQNEILVETKVCKHCGISFPITDKDMEFYEKVSPVFPAPSSWTEWRIQDSTGTTGFFASSEWRIQQEWDKIRYLIPTPTLCPDCRQQRRLSFRNERKLYKRKCDATGKDIISIYAPGTAYPVFSQDYWWSDHWNPLSYGCDFNETKWFFSQFQVLFDTVPKLALVGSNNENSQYINLSADCKNCYIVIESSNNEDCLYGYWLQKCNDCIDVSFCHECESSYEIQDCFGCFNLFYSNNCDNCQNSLFLENCVGCSHCIGSTNLTNKEYYIFDQAYTREEYFSRVEQYILPSIHHIQKQFEQHTKHSIKKYGHISMAQNSSGDYMKSVKNCISCFHAYDAEDCKYSEHVWRNAKEIMDCSTVGRDAFLIYETINSGINVARNLFCAICWESTGMSYCISCFGSHDCFWCVWLRNASYCILNRQYTKEEYETLVPKIIEHMIATGEWGEFFPSSLSPFGYNETVAQEYFPLTASSLTLLPVGEGNETGSETLREAIVPPPSPLGEGMRVRWSLYEAPFPRLEKTILATQLPEDIMKIPDDILNWAIECEVTGKLFRITKQELGFYRKHHLPIPRRHPDQRHSDRMKIRNSQKLYTRSCDACEKNMITTYAPTSGEIVYCEECYQKKVVH